MPRKERPAVKVKKRAFPVVQSRAIDIMDRKVKKRPSMKKGREHNAKPNSGNVENLTIKIIEKISLKTLNIRFSPYFDLPYFSNSGSLGLLLPVPLSYLSIQEKNGASRHKP